ncbi:MAG: carboxypeptidase regulatory-like domain-containing protein, partial [Armatimonadota bacterium]
GSAGLRVIDVSDPAAPLEVGFLDTPGTAYHVAVAGGYAYVADGASGLRVIDVSNAAAPVEVGSCHPPDLAYGIALASGYAYVADVYGRLRVIDVSDPAAPLEVGSCDTPGYTYGVAVADGYAYVADWFGLTVVDTSNPAAPVEVGYLDTPSLAVGVAVADGYAYVGDYNAGLRVIDITNPAAPVEVGYLDTPGNVYSVAVAGGYAYVADNGWGLVVGGGRGDVAGQVRRRGTTTNLPGATVEARQEGTLKGSDVTGLTGLYSVPNLLPGAYVLTAGKAGYGNQSKSDVRITPGQDGQYVNFNLYPVQLTGQVSQAGTTTYLAGATVRVYQGNVLKASANTDGGGIYRIGGLPDGTYDAVASHAGYVRQFKLDVPIAAGSVTNRNFFLAVSGRLKGQVKDRTTGRNLPGATVFARSGGITWAKTRAKDWAVYEINADLPPGTYVMQASQPGYLSQAKKGIVVTAGATSIVNFNLDPLLKGQVRQAGTTTNLAGATVKVYQADVLRATTTTDARGIYQVGGLAAGTYTAVASKAGYVRQTKHNITISEAAYTYVNFNLSVSGKLKGQVKNRVTGANLIGATVFARSGGIIWATTTTTAPWGIYEINADLPPGTYVMQASRPGYLPQAKKGVIVTAGNTTYVNFSLQPQ